MRFVATIAISLPVLAARVIAKSAALSRKDFAAKVLSMTRFAAYASMIPWNVSCSTQPVKSTVNAFVVSGFADALWNQHMSVQMPPTVAFLLTMAV